MINQLIIFVLENKFTKEAKIPIKNYLLDELNKKISHRKFKIKSKIILWKHIINQKKSTLHWEYKSESNKLNNKKGNLNKIKFG